MITVNNVSLSFDGTTLFSDVNLKFTPGNCYGIIGANGAGKSTFLKILSGVKEPTTGEIIIPANVRMSVLKQDHYAYDTYTVMDTVIMGNAVYMKLCSKRMRCMPNSILAKKTVFWLRSWRENLLS